MSEDGQRLFAASTPVLQLKKNFLDAHVTVPPMENVIVGALTDQGIGHVSAFDLFGFDVKKHMDGRLHGVGIVVVVVVVVQRRDLNETLVGFNVHVLLTGVTMSVSLSLIHI